MAKVFMGVRLQRLREERRMTQVALAKSLGISPSYLNQMERNQRPLTVPILLRIGSVLGVDPQIFSEHDSASLVADVRDVFGELPDAPPTSMAELKMLVENMPELARSILLLQRRYRVMAERADTLAARLDDGSRGASSAAPSTDEEVREYLNRRQNITSMSWTAPRKAWRVNSIRPCARSMRCRGVCWSATASGCNCPMATRAWCASTATMPSNTYCGCPTP
ncbi:helix-turn-helix domain-containing protein [Janthinobacterium sp.]|uniref:helix-turn-helix domain-containing protein n=1 Tax=Janthinobacterium sp. TaxID=1871054 RepID=UPI002582DE23|nr:helix-turn-helix domain-containing protein [Janthinobacterium sp.]MCX7293461.1 helix-turn-helix domain-containing protein [Janthinobacterium sp.]